MTEGSRDSMNKTRYLRVKRVLLFTTIIGSIIVSGNLAPASELSTNGNSNIKATIIQYNDFKDG